MLADSFVPEDAASWRLQAWCGGRNAVLRFGSTDNQARGWFAFSLREFGLSLPVEGPLLAHLSACFEADAARLGPLLSHGQPSAFLEEVGAPVAPMSESGLVRLFGELAEGENSVRFPWEAGQDWEF